MGPEPLSPKPTFSLLTRCLHGSSTAKSRRGVGLTHWRINPQEDLKNACPSGLLETADGSLNRNHWFGKTIWRYLILVKVNTSSHSMTQSRGAEEIHALQTALLGREQDLSVTPPATRRAI